MMFMVLPPLQLYHSGRWKKSFDASVLQGRAAEALRRLGLRGVGDDRIQLQHIAKYWRW